PFELDNELLSRISMEKVCVCVCDSNVNANAQICTSLTMFAQVHVGLLQQWHLEDQLEKVTEALTEMAEELGGVDIAIMKQLQHNIRGLCRLLTQDTISRENVEDYSRQNPQSQSQQQ